MRHTLPHLALLGDAPGTGAAARWKRLETEQQPVRACTLCTLHRSHGATDTARAHPAAAPAGVPAPPPSRPDPRLTSPIRTGVVPELAAAHHTHQRLPRHPRAGTAWTAARAITTRWYDHRHHLTQRWQPRLTRLITDSAPLAATSSASPALLAHDLVIHPETAGLARTLATPLNRPYRTTDDAPSFIVHRLGLPRLASNANDPLRAFLTHTRH